MPGARRALHEASIDELLSELGRRGCGADLDGEVDALHDDMDLIGAMGSDSALTAYLVYRLRREASGRESR